MHDTGLNTSRIVIACYAFLALFFLHGCGARAIDYRVRVLHQNDRFDGEELAGQSVVLFPPVAGGRFDSTGTLAFVEQRKSVLAIRQDLHLCAPAEFERAFIGRHSSASLDSFYQNLTNNRLLAIQTADSVWQSVPCEFAFIARVVEGARVRSFDGMLKRRVCMEGELWRASTREVVWRAQAIALDAAVEMSDEAFLAQGLSALYRALPEFRPALNEKNW